MGRMAKQMLQGRRVVIMGLGLNRGGLVSAQFCLAKQAEVLVTDLRSESELAQSVRELKNFARMLADTDAPKRLHFHLGGHEFADFQNADLVVKNPGVRSDSPYLLAAQSWTTDLALFFDSAPQVPVLAITGTKGKSSIAYALHYILQQYYAESEQRVMLGGNIGDSPLSFALQELIDSSKAGLLNCKNPLVIELSSWQLADLRAVEQSGQLLFRPKLACISNILHDHQDRYARFADYMADKFYIFHSMGTKNEAENWAKEEPELILPCTPPNTMFLGPHFWSDSAVREFSHTAQIHYFSDSSTFGSLEKGQQGIYWQHADDGSINCYVRNRGAPEQLFANSKGFRPLGEQSFQNYCIASYMAYRFLRQQGELSGPEAFCQQNQKWLSDFGGVPFRMELRATAELPPPQKNYPKKYLYFINDTTATMPEAAAAGLHSCLQVPGSRCLLIAGGADKALNPGPLLRMLREQLLYKNDKIKNGAETRVHLFVLEGSGSTKLLQLLNGLPYFAGASGKGFSSLEAAFTQACAVAKQIETGPIYVLLSPGYASFGMFVNEFERGALFNQLVERYTANLQTDSKGTI